MLLFLYNYSEQEAIDAFMNPQRNYRSAEYIEKQVPEVLKFLAVKGVSYGSEISASLGIAGSSIFDILNECIKNGWVENISPDPYMPDRIFFRRIPYFWQQGKVGYEAFAKCKWVILTPLGIQHMKDSNIKCRVGLALIEHWSPELKVEE